MNDELKKTVRIVRRPKVKTDERGRTVWADTVETANLELVSTQMLDQLIEADDDATKNHLRDVAGGKDGVLAHDADKGRFEIISDDELQQILDGTDAQLEVKKAGFIEEPSAEAVADEEEFELVSTQMLRQILSPEDFSEDVDGEPDASGFDPYDHG